MKFFLFVNTRKDEDLSLTKGIVNSLEKRNIDYVLFKADSDDCSVDEDTIVDVEAAIVLGGDGTMLHAIREIADKDIPVFGVNIGHMGFLTEVEYQDFESAIDEIIQKDYFIEERIMLSSSGQDELTAVNDVCIINKEPGKVISVTVSINGNFVEEFSGDGIIICSPTGSTGYSMSAGGPIVSPQASCIIITPICAHSLTVKPIVLCDSDQVSIDVLERKKGLAIIDGQRRREVTSLTVRKSTHKAKFIRFKDYNFFNVLSKKFNNTKDK